MNKQKIILYAASIVLMISLGFPAPRANAQVNPSPDTRVGCIHRGPTSLRFIDTSSRTRADILNDLQASQEHGTTGPVDSCLTGQKRNIPAPVYRGMADRFPNTFEPLAAPPRTVNPTTVSDLSPIRSGQTGFPFRFSYLNLDALAPSGFLPFMTTEGITDDNRVVGNVFDNDFNPFLAVYENGSIKVLRSGAFPLAVTRLGKIGGAVVTDATQGFTQAALFREHSTELIPRAAGEVSSEVQVMNDFGIVIVNSVDVDGKRTRYVYANGRLKPLDLNIEGQVEIFAINNFGTVVGFRFLDGKFTAYRHNVLTGSTTLLPPLSTEPHSWAIDINDFGDIVGYSFIASGRERIGIWNAAGRFETYFTEGTPEFPTISNRLLLNNSRLIVITLSFNDPQSYLVPRKGIRLPLSDLIDYDPVTNGPPQFVVGLTTFGAMAGFTTQNSFLITPKLNK